MKKELNTHNKNIITSPINIRKYVDIELREVEFKSFQVKIQDQNMKQKKHSSKDIIIQNSI